MDRYNMIYTDDIHLITNKDINELHMFAQKKLGINKKYFQNKKYPYYDLFGRKIRLAKKLGAQKVSTRQLTKILTGKTYGSIK